MAKKGVKPGTQREPYKRKTKRELKEAQKVRQDEAEILLPEFLEPLGYKWSLDWRDPEMLKKGYLCSFAGLTPVEASRILGSPKEEILEALKGIPEFKSHWDRGQEEIVTLCHVALTQRIRGMKITEIRKTEKADGGVDVTTITKELPPDIDAVKYFLNNRVAQYQEVNPASAFEGRLDTMLGKIEQMDMFD